jgi:hypothetical protein
MCHYDHKCQDYLNPRITILKWLQKLPKPIKTGKANRFLVQNSIFKIWRKKQKNQAFLGLLIGFLIYQTNFHRFLFKTQILNEKW